MEIRRLISATLIVGLGLIFIELTQSSNYEVVQAIEKIQETEFADREAVDFILEKFEEGDATASDFIVDYDNLTEFIEIRPNIVEELAALKLPHLDASLARQYSSGSFGSQLDWSRSLELYLSGLEGCSTRLGVSRSPLINGVDLIQLANLSEAELNRIHEKLQYCANYDFLAANELALFEWKLLGENQKFLQFIDYEREAFSGFFNEYLETLALSESDIQRAEEIAETIKPEFGDKLYIYNTNERLGINSLASASQALAERNNVEASSLYGALQWYPKQTMEEIPSGSFEAEDQARQVLSESADFNGLAATYLYFLSHPEYGVELSEEDDALLMLKMIQSDFGPGACYADDRIYGLFPQYTDDELDAATSMLCAKGYQHQLDLLEEFATNDYASTDRDPDFSLYDTPYFSLLPELGESGPTVLAPSGMSATLVGLIFLYLAYLTFAANQTASRNRAVSSILLGDGLMLICCFGLLLLPTRLSLIPLAKALILPIPFIVFGLITAQSYFISTFNNDFASRFTKYYLGPIFVIGGIFIFLDEVFLYASDQPGRGPLSVPLLTSQPGFFFWSVSPLNMALLSAELLLMHVCVFASVLFEHRLKRGNKNSETAYYLSAYFFRILFLGISLGSVALGYTNELRYLIISSYIFGELIYGLLFCYGIVKGNIFGVTQLIKRGMVKLLFTASLFTVFYFMEGIVSNEFSDALGNLAGFLGASLLLMFEKPINKYAYNFIDYLIPDNESLGTSEEAYLYLYRVAIEDGTISQDEQRMLDSMAQKLELGAEDVQRIKNTVNRTT